MYETRPRRRHEQTGQNKGEKISQAYVYQVPVSCKHTLFVSRIYEETAATMFSYRYHWSITTLSSEISLRFSPNRVSLRLLLVSPFKLHHSTRKMPQSNFQIVRERFVIFQNSYRRCKK